MARTRMLMVFLAVFALFVSILPAQADPPEPGYVIISTEAILTTNPVTRAAIDAFANYKDTHGYTVYLQPLEGMPRIPGDSTATMIRTWLQSRYIGLNLRYVLLIGNPHPVSGDVPMLMQGAIPTDFYYSELTGSVPGSAVPVVCDVMVGRIPYLSDDPNILKAILEKTVAYAEAAPDTTYWRRRMLIPIHPLDADHAFDQTYRHGENVKNGILQPNGWEFHRIYELSYSLYPPPETMPCSNGTVWNVLGALETRERFGAIYWTSHGCAHHAENLLELEDALLLDPTYPSFIVQGSCDTAEPEFPNMAEAVLRTAAVVTVAATRQVFPEPMRDLAYNFLDGVITRNESAGRAFCGAQETRLVCAYNLYGDPSLALLDPVAPFHFEPVRREHGYSAENGDFRVVTDTPAYAWTSDKDRDWIHIISGSGTGTGIVTYRLDANPGLNERSGAIYVNSKPFFIKQTAFPEMTDISSVLTGVKNADIAWGDYDNDGDLDLLVCGTQGTTKVTKLYRNDGSAGGTGWAFTPITTTLAGFEGCATWGDYDNDGSLDLLLTGWRAGTGRYTQLYHNDFATGSASWQFTEITTDLREGMQSNADWGDFDNDGDLDLLINGYGLGATGIFTELFRNDGQNGVNAWQFTKMTTALPAAYDGKVAWADFDKDGDLDVFVSGNPTTPDYFAKIFSNDGAGGGVNWNFGDVSAGLRGSNLGSIDCADFNNDGYIDLLVTGRDSWLTPAYTIIYRNDYSLTGTWTFTDIGAGLLGVDIGTARWGDCDNDGLPDVIVNGRWGGAPVCRLYHNDGSTFSEIDVDVSGVEYGAMAFGDFNKDGKLDLAVAGQIPGPGGTVSGIAKVYRNVFPTANTPPTAPTGLARVPAPSIHDMSFTWITASDAQTPVAGLSYNVSVGTTPGGHQIRPPHADTSLSASNGYRRIVAPADIGNRSIWTITNLPGGRYWWSVQAVDGAFAGGPFASEQTFTVDPTISGRVTAGGAGLSGVEIRGLPVTVVTDVDGYYTAVVPYDWTGTATPFKTGYFFAPARRDYLRIIRDEPNQDFAALQVRVRLEYMTEQPNNPHNIQMFLCFYNEGTANINLSDLTATYWYKSEWPDMETGLVNDARVKLSGRSDRDIKAASSATPIRLSPPRGTQDRKVVVAFAPSAGVLEPGARVEIKLQVYDADWQNRYNFGNDYSFGNHSTKRTWTKITMYHAGTLVWGLEP